MIEVTLYITPLVHTGQSWYTYVLSKDPLYQNSFTASPLPSQNSPNFISDAPLSDITESSNSEGCEDDKELLEDLIDDPSTANRLASLAFFLLHDNSFLEL